MKKHIKQAFERFSKTASEIDHPNLTSIKTDLFEHVDRIAELIEQSLDLYTKDRGLRLGKKMDRLFHSYEAAHSIRNRGL